MFFSAQSVVEQFTFESSPHTFTSASLTAIVKRMMAKQSDLFCTITIGGTDIPVRYAVEETMKGMLGSNRRLFKAYCMKSNHKQLLFDLNSLIFDAVALIIDVSKRSFVWLWRFILNIVFSDNKL